MITMSSMCQSMDTIMMMSTTITVRGITSQRRARSASSRTTGKIGVHFMMIDVITKFRSLRERKNLLRLLART